MSDKAGPFVELHSVFDADHPAQAEYAKTLEEIRRGNLGEAYVPSRLFPCPGVLRRIEDGSPIVVCDQCRFEVCMPVETPVSSTGQEW